MKLTRAQIELLSRHFGIPEAELEGKTMEQARAMLAQLGAARAMSSIVPTTANETAREVDVVIATEAPVQMFDYSRWEVVDEVLLMTGLRLGEIRQGKLPLLDTHQRGSAKNVLGSTTNLRVEGDKFVGTRQYSEVSAPEFRKTVEGHLDQASVGYRVFAATYIEPGQTANVGGRQFAAPANRALKIVTDWIAYEDSVCPIGADTASGVRSLSALFTNPNQPQQSKEKRSMQKYIEFLKRNGYTGSTDTEARTFIGEHPELLEKFAEEQRTTAATTATAGDSTAAARAAGAAEERARQDGIRALCVRFGCDDQVGRLINEGRSIAEAQTHISEIMLARSHANQPGSVGGVTVVADESDKVRAAFTDALAMRGGHTIEKPAAGAEDVRGFTLLEMGREILRRNGQSGKGTPQEIAARALSTSDFPLILANVANKSLFAGFDTAEETWNQFCDTGEVPDFKDQTIVRIGETDDLAEVKEGAGYTYASRTEGKETFRVYKYGKLFAMTWETIVNDDLNALTDIPQQHGQACSRLEGDISYAVLTANAAMGDAKALFHNDHGNLAGAGAVIGAAPLAAGILAMKLQKDEAGKRRLNIRPNFVLGPAAVEGAAEIFFGSQFMDNTSNVASNRINPYAGKYFTRVYDARLDDNSATAWYLLGPKGKTIRVFFLRGQRAPYLETKQGFEVDGIVFKVRHVVGAKALSWKAMYKNPGA